MFNLGFTEMLVICALALIFIGPKQLPEVARAIGKFINELKRASDEALEVFRETKSKSNDFIRKTEEQFNVLNEKIEVDKLLDGDKKKSGDGDQA